MLKEFLVRYVILGHSERRQYQEETDSLISKALAAHAASIKPIVCVGETLERDSGVTNDVVGSQVKGSLAGSPPAKCSKPLSPTNPSGQLGPARPLLPSKLKRYHFIRGVLSDLHGDEVARRVRIQYGGSVKPERTRAHESA